ncbi:GntR family transcriptional regulator [Paenibacillus tarimensis]|uniref:GntR family transcriptional regulator n=1 Tax=Paenibacillus tarimensis TaxID=416012 RepID=UPI001F35A90C|nr:GntR family transcriptional regulator [Paenibacillus tarimensis]MCF2945074.1 GntR family transcriptional regulator [Paenibacillus tarimensis]
MIPSYIQIKDKLDRMMVSGELPVGRKLPSEPELAASFGVSRETLRAALKQLEQEGKLRCRNGVGRFVIRPLHSIPSSIDKLSSTSEMIHTSGLQETEVQESVRIDRCQQEWAEYLNLEDGDEVIVIERIRKANDDPVSFNINVLPHHLVGTAFARRPLQGSLMTFLEEECSIRLVSAMSEVIVPPAKDLHAKKLRVSPEATVLLLKQTHFDEDNRPVLFSYDYYRNDVFKFWVRRSR